MMKILAFSVVLLVAGCAALGVPPANTFNKRAYVANVTIEAAAKTVKQLYDAGKIDNEQRHELVDNLKTVAGTVDAAVNIHWLNPEEANTRLDAAVVALQALEAYLRTKQ
jgi:hypothetical protein